jgi:catechol-2,3-dioxygenase
MTGFSLGRLDHVSLNVGDRVASIAWYRDVLEQRNEPRRDDWPVLMGELGACVALFQATTESPEPERAGESTGLRHVAFAVARDDVDRAQEHMRELGVDFRSEDHGSAHSLYVADPDGNVVELTSYVT